MKQYAIMATYHHRDTAAGAPADGVVLDSDAITGDGAHTRHPPLLFDSEADAIAARDDLIDALYHTAPDGSRVCVGVAGHNRIKCAEYRVIEYNGANHHEKK